MSKYGEPWTYKFGCIKTKNGDVANGTENEKRKVACVNALAGVPHPKRLPELLAACRRLAKVLAGPIDDNATITACERLVEAYAEMMERRRE